MERELQSQAQFEGKGSWLGHTPPIGKQKLRDLGTCGAKRKGLPR